MNQPARRRIGCARGGVFGKKDQQNMAKTTRKTETDPAAARPAARRKPLAAPAEGTEKASTRRRTKTEAVAAPAPATADSRPAKADRPIAAAPIPEPAHDQIAVRAYYIFLRRGATDGHADRDWFRARAELLYERRQKG